MARSADLRALLARLVTAFAVVVQGAVAGETALSQDGVRVAAWNTANGPKSPDDANACSWEL